MRQILNKEIGTACILLLLAGSAWFYTNSIPAKAAMFPRIVIGMIAFLATVYLVRELLSRRIEDTTTALLSNPRRFAVGLVLIVAYITIFPLIGYFTTTFIFIQVFVAAMGMRRFRMAFLSSAIFSLGTYVLFVILLNRSLPDEIIIRLIVGF